MCRMILAIGEIAPETVFSACQKMAKGECAQHNHPVKIHPNGWGGMMKRKNRPYQVIRSMNPIFKDDYHLMQKGDTVQLSAFHARHATLEKNQGLSFCHPLHARFEEEDWYMMHNGFLPTVYQKLGKQKSEFDSQEYMQFLVPLLRLGDQDIADKIVGELDQLSEINTSGNAFIFTGNTVYVFQWFLKHSQYARFYTLNVYEDDAVLLVSSEIIPDILPARNWRPMKRGELLTITL